MMPIWVGARSSGYLYLDSYNEFLRYKAAAVNLRERDRTMMLNQIFCYCRSHALHVVLIQRL